MFQEGELIQLKCHSWKNTPVRNVQYFQNGRGKKFFYNNSEYHIPAATSEHNGSYFCRGIIGKKNESSEAVNIIIQGESCAALELPEPCVYGVCIHNVKMNGEILDYSMGFFMRGSRGVIHSAMWQHKQKPHVLPHKNTLVLPFPSQTMATMLCVPPVLAILPCPPTWWEPLTSTQGGPRNLVWLCCSSIM